MNDAEIIRRLEDVIAALIREKGALGARLEILEPLVREARNQIMYLHDKFQETGSGNSVIARVDAALEAE